MLRRSCPSNFGGASDLLSPQTDRLWFEIFSAVNLAAMGFLSFAAYEFLARFHYRKIAFSLHAVNLGRV